MPLLKRKAFEKSTASGYLRDDDEVFHCEITDEIFKDYEEYCERIILVNSMVWTCEMTGKNNLTYAEALQSEKAAKKQLKDFPIELRIPILYLAMRTKRSSFAEMSEDIFNFVRDRYFVGETVEACLNGDIWRESHILSVTSQKQHPDSKSILPAASYCYEVEQFDDKDPSTNGVIGTAPFDRVRRPKGVYTRDKNRLFLKQFVEYGGGSLLTIKQSALEKYNINKVNFSQIFTGNPPEFAPSKKLLKNGPSPPKKAPGSASKLNKSLKKPSPDKKGRQESMDKFVKKTDKPDASKPKPPADPEAKKSAQELAEKMRRAEDQMRQRKEEEKAKKKEKHARLQAYLKEWQRVKDDLDLEDHKVIPQGTVINIEGIPQEHIGDFFSVLEFIHTYSDILKAKDVFHSKFDVEMFRKALTMKEHAATMCDLVQMFLTTIFSLQEDEADEYNENKGIQPYTEDKDTDSTVDTNKAIELATKASKWCQTYLGTPLSKLPIDPITVTEVLRLHLLSSGAEGGARCAAWRCQARGGYCSADDPGLRLRLARPRLLARLAHTHVADLPLDDKFQILQCLMNQILTYATVRDVIEERQEEQRNKKYALKMLQVNERKREAQVLASKQELRKEATVKKVQQNLTGDKARAVDDELKLAIDKINAENEQKKKEYESKVKEMQAELFEYMSYLGSDRAFRRYWVLRSVGGVFIEAGAEPRGTCRDKLVLPRPPAQDTLTYVTQLFEMQKEKGSSDKENDSAANSRGNSPKKPLTNLNGLNHKLNGIETNIQQLRELMMCTGDHNKCFVHGNEGRPSWEVLHSAEQLSAVEGALNGRGAREQALLAALRSDPPALAARAAACPLHALCAGAAPPPAPRVGPRRQPRPSIVVPPDCTLAEAVELSLRDHILELEEKIFHGCLGSLKVKDREAWRGTLMLRGYDKQAPYLSWGLNQMYRDDYNLLNGVLVKPTDPDSDVVVTEYKYRDPGQYLEAEGGGAQTELVRTLASALLQVSQAIHHKYLKRPLGIDEKERREREARGLRVGVEPLWRWQESGMAAVSLGGVALHLQALDLSVAWSASILNASCRICRRRANPDAMLLCDGCNKGHHLHCLKPKLTSVPEGDWFCDHCRPKEPPQKKKRRKLFSDDDLDETVNSEEESFELDAGVCGSCGSGGRLRLQCSGCSTKFHSECLPHARDTRRWMCDSCLHPQRDSEDSEYNTALVKLKTRKHRGSKESSPLQNGTTKRTRKSKEETNTSRKSKNSLTNGSGVHEERSSGRRRRQQSPALHSEALHTLMKDVMKHKDSWPFYEPVSPDEVPDYLEIISKPMDLSTMLGKLERGEYSGDAELLADAALLFSNCYTYNQDTHPVARAGYRLEKYFNKRCKELNLPQLPDTDPEADESNKKRSSPVDEQEAPKPKKAKLK